MGRGSCDAFALKLLNDDFPQDSRVYAFVYGSYLLGSVQCFSGFSRICAVIWFLYSSSSEITTHYRHWNQFNQVLARLFNKNYLGC